MSHPALLSVKTTIAVGDGPHSIAVTNNGDRLYVTNFHGGTVSVIDPERELELAHVPVGEHLSGIALDPASEEMFVGEQHRPALLRIERASFDTTMDTGIQQRPYGLAGSPDGEWNYMACAIDNAVVKYDHLNKPHGLFSNVDFPVGLAVSREGSRIYASNYFAETISVLDATKAHQFSTPSLDALVATIPVPRGPYGLALSPDGDRLYVAHFPFETVSVIDTARGTLIDSIPVPDGPRGVGISPDGEELYVTNFFASTVSVIAL